MNVIIYTVFPLLVSVLACWLAVSISNRKLQRELDRGRRVL
jgi:hypothetical protein